MALRQACLRWLLGLALVLPALGSAAARGLVLSADSLPLSLNAQWRFTPGHDPKYARPEYNDSAWQRIGSVRRLSEAERELYGGKGWFRLHFETDSSLLGQVLAFNLEFEGAFDLYLDGQLLYRYGSMAGGKASEYENPKQTPLAFQFQRAGPHVLAIRVEEYPGNYNYFVGFGLILRTYKDGLVEFYSEAVVITFINVFIGVIFLTLGIIHLFFFLYYRSILSNLLFSVFMFSVSAITGLFQMMYVVDKPADYDQLSLISALIAPVSVLSFSLFIHFIFHEKTRLWIYAATVLTLLFYALELFDWYNEPEQVLVLGMVTVFVHALIRIVVSLIRRQPGTWIIGIGTGFTVLSLLSFLLVGTFGTIEANTETFVGQVVLFGLAVALISIPLSMSVYQAWSFARLNKSLQIQLVQVQELSAKTIQQELEKQQILENQKQELEVKVEERTRQLKEEKQKSDDLLLNILPAEVAEELKNKGSAEARLVEEVTVIFTDFKGFTQMAEVLSPQALVHDIHECFSAFDRIMEKYGIEKIKTIGDAYMAASGLPTPNGEHAMAAVKAALEMVEFIEAGKALKIEKGLPYFEIRVGVHSGPVVAGIVGIKKFAYDIWGDTVNTAARMESSGDIGRVNISEATYALVHPYFACSYRGEVDAKGKGKVRMYFVNPNDADPAALAIGAESPQP